MSDTVSSASLLTRSGLPDDLRWLVERYPREQWSNHAGLGGMASFWLQRHAMFRELGTMLNSGIGDYRDGKFAAPEFALWFAPRLRFFLHQLQGHHQVEDLHYFPLFAEAEQRLKRGFDILDSDHHVIHDALERNAEAGNAFLRALQENQDRQRVAADVYAEENARLIAMLVRHLDDEEDLIIPLILDRGEEGLGVG
jgi:hypothetical protein